MPDNTLLDNLKVFIDFCADQAQKDESIDEIALHLKQLMVKHNVRSSIKWNQLIVTLKELQSIQDNPQKKREQRLLKEQIENTLYADFAKLPVHEADKPLVDNLFIELCSIYKINQIHLPKSVESPIPESPKSKELNIQTIKKFNREQLINDIVNNLSPVLAKEIKDKKPPIEKYDDDPPQVMAIKDLINASAQIEDAYQYIAQGGATNYLSAVYQIYRAYQHVTHASPELMELIQANKVYLEPLLSNARSIINTIDSSKLMSVDDTISKAGQWVNYLGDVDRQPDNIATLALSIVNQLPQTIDHVYQNLSQDETVDKQIKILSQKQVEKLGQNIDVLIKLGTSEQHGLAKMISPIHHISSAAQLKNILKFLVDDNDNQRREGFKLYEKWIQEDYPSFVLWLDGLEDQLYLKKGCLTDVINQSIKNLYNKSLGKEEHNQEIKDINTIVNFIKREHDSKELAISRLHDCDIRIEILERERTQLKEEYQSLKKLFTTLNDLNVREIYDLPEDVRTSLRNHYPLIQPYLNMDFSEDREIVDALNAPPVSTISWLFGKLLENPDGDRAGQIGLILANERQILNQYQTKINRLHFKEKIILEGKSHILSTNDIFLHPYEVSNQNELNHAEIQIRAHRLTIEYDKLIKFMTKFENNTLTKKQAVDEYVGIQYLINSVDPTLDKRLCDLVNKKKLKQFAVELKQLNDSGILGTFMNTEGKRLKELDNTQPPLITTIPMGALAYRANNSNSMIKNLLGAFQSYQLSQKTKAGRETIKSYRQSNLSSIAKERFDDTKKFQIDDPSDPESIKHIKLIENCLTNIEDLMVKIESIDPDAGFMNHIFNVASISPDLFKLMKELNKLKDLIGQLSPELYEQISPYISDIYYVANQTSQEMLTDKQANKENNKILQFLAKGLNATSSVLNEELTMRYLSTDSSIPSAIIQQQEKEISSKKASGKFNQVSKIKNIYIAADKLYHNIQNLGKTAHDAVTENCNTIKTDLLTSILIPLNAYEDKLLLEPGTMLTPVLNQLEHSYQLVIAELNIPFEEKITILDNRSIYDALIYTSNKTKSQIYDKINECLHDEQETIEALQLELVIINEKINYLELKRDEHIKQIQAIHHTVNPTEQNSPNVSENHSKIQYKDMLKKVIKAKINAEIPQLKSSEIKKFYINIMEEHVYKHYDSLLKILPDEVDDAINTHIKEFNQQHDLDIQFIDESYALLYELNQSTNDKPSKAYLDNKMADLKDINIPFQQKVESLKSLSKDRTFLNIASQSTKGLSILNKLEQLINRFEKAIKAMVKDRTISSVIIAAGTSNEPNKKMVIKQDLKEFRKTAKEIEKKSSQQTSVPGA